MSDLIQTTTHEADGVARLLERFRGLPVFEALLRIALQRTQHVENVLWAIYTGVRIDNAVGVQLDNLGDVVGEPRKGRDDDKYRLWIRARIAINRANGKISDSLKVARLVIEPSATVVYEPDYPAGYRMSFTGSAVPLADLFELLNEVRPAGVFMNALSADDDATALILDDASAPFVDGTINGLDVGLMADLV